LQGPGTAEGPSGESKGINEENAAERAGEADVTAVISPGSRLGRWGPTAWLRRMEDELRAETPRGRGHQPPAEQEATVSFEGQRHWQSYDPSNPPHACGSCAAFHSTTADQKLRYPSLRLTAPQVNPRVRLSDHTDLDCSAIRKIHKAAGEKGT
jgi:hypothetical protein